MTFTIDASVWVAALESSDHFHLPSVRFLRTIESKRIRLWAPSIVIPDVSCALARRSRNAAYAADIKAQLGSHPLLSLRRLDDELLESARVLGTQNFLRAGDALYLATAMLEAAALVTWDNELLTRTNALSPDQALNAIG